MISISDAAVEKAKEILSTEGKPDCGLRVYIAGSSCCGPSIGMDIIEHPDESDETFEKNGLKVFVEKSASEKLNGMEIHFIDEGEKQGFLLTGGKPQSCGTSHGHNACG